MVVAEIIESQKKSIIEKWLVSLTEELPEIKGHEKSAIENSIPDLMDAVVKSLRNNEVNVSQESIEHGVQRTTFDQYSIHHIVREYHLVKIVVFQVVDEYTHIQPYERNMILKVIDMAVEKSCESYHRIKNEVHVNARKIAEKKANELKLEGSHREEFIQSISHDLNNPLTNIKGCIDLIERNPDVDNISQIFRILNRNVQQAESLVRDFLNVGQIDKDSQLPIRIAKVNIVEKIKDEVNTYNVASRAEIEFNSEKSSLLIKVDIELLLRALNNLINNAIKHGKSDSKILVKLEEKVDLVEISVHNEGQAIPQEVRENIFNKYYQVFASRSGWGIGLAFAKKVLDAHEGEITLESEEGKGTTFFMRIPIR